MIEKPCCPECNDMGMPGRGCPACGLKEPTEAAAKQQRQIAEVKAQIEALGGRKLNLEGKPKC